MAKRILYGADLLCDTLQNLGINTVFGIPGTQNVHLYNALADSSLRAFTATDELKASFMANGYSRASGKLAVVSTIPGPGFTYALSGIAEAHHDSVPVLFLSLGKPHDKEFALQALDQKAVVTPLVKKTFEVTSLEDITPILSQAYSVAMSGEPGPVYIEVATDLLHLQTKHNSTARNSLTTVSHPGPSAEELVSFLDYLKNAKRPLFYVGQGAFPAAERLCLLAEQLCCPIMTTCSGRGVISETHPLSFYSDLSYGINPIVKTLFERSDLVIVLGGKLTHNGTAGFLLPLANTTLIHVDLSEEVLGANYKTHFSLQCDITSLLSAIPTQNRAQWSEEELSLFRDGFDLTKRTKLPLEPKIHLLNEQTMLDFFQALRAALSSETILVTDSGLHQALARHYFQVLTPQTFIVPTDFQAMGYGIPAAIGAKLASPHSPVVALVGDGAFLSGGMELMSAVREELELTVIIFNDSSYNLIRHQQIEKFGRAHQTTILNPDFSLLSEAFGCTYFRAEGSFFEVMSQAQNMPGVKIVEVKLGDTLSTITKKVVNTSRETAHRSLPRSFVAFLKYLRERFIRG